MILRALGAEPPVSPTCPLLHGPDGKKLSKRHGAASVQELRETATCPRRCATTWRCSAGARRVDHLYHYRGADRAFRPLASRGTRPSSTSRSFAGLTAATCASSHRGPRSPGSRRAGARRPPEAVEISPEKLQTLADFWPLAGFLVERPADYDQKAWSKVMAAGAPDRLRSAREASRRRAFPRRTWSRRCGRRRRPDVRGRGLPADPRRDHRQHRLAGDLRVGRRARPRGVARPHRCRARARRRPSEVNRFSAFKRWAADRACDGALNSLWKPRSLSPPQFRRPEGAATHRGPRPPLHGGVRGARGLPGARGVPQPRPEGGAGGPRVGERGRGRGRVRRRARHRGVADREPDAQRKQRQDR